MNAELFILFPLVKYCELRGGISVQKYWDLIMGLVSGLVLMLLNNTIVLGTIASIATLFNPMNINPVSIFIMNCLSRIIIILSFIGIVIAIICAILILKRIFKSEMK